MRTLAGHMHARLVASLRVALALALSCLACPVYVASAAASSWDVVRNGDSFVFTISGEPYLGGNQWNIDEQLFITYNDGTQGASNAIKIIAGPGVKDAWYQDIPGASITASSNNTRYTMTIPAAFFANPGFSISYSGKTTDSASISGNQPVTPPQPEEPEEPEEPQEPEDPVDPVDPNDPTDPTDPVDPTDPNDPTDPADPSNPTDPSKPGSPTQPSTPTDPTQPGSGSYGGIVIDGQFADWGAVSKTDVNEGGVGQVAMVWDGDWVYLYFMMPGEGGQGNWDRVTWSGPHNNGKFVIRTDLGRELPFQLVSSGGAPGISGVDGAHAAVNNTSWAGAPHMWELAIPASALPEYLETISFGYAMGDMLVEDVANLQKAPEEGPAGTFTGIVIDGHYDDWKYYPHANIQYSDEPSLGALYSNGQKVYGHAITTVPSYLANGGGELTQAMNIRLNENDALTFSPRLIAVDSAGNIDWNPQISNLADGTYKFAMVSQSNSQTGATNVSELTGGNVVYGTMYVTVAPGKNECEFEIDTATLAANAGSQGGAALSPGDIKTVQVQWAQLGSQWVTCAGTSTGPELLLVICGIIAVAGAYMRMHARKGSGSQASLGGQDRAGEA